MQSQHSSLRSPQSQHPTQSRQQKLWSQRKTPYASLAASPSRSCPEAHHTRPWREQTQTKPYSRKAAASEAFVTAELPPLPLPPTPAHRLQQEATKMCRKAGARRGAVTNDMSLNAPQWFHHATIGEIRISECLVNPISPKPMIKRFGGNPGVKKKYEGQDDRRLLLPQIYNTSLNFMTNSIKLSHESGAIFSRIGAGKFNHGVK